MKKVFYFLLLFVVLSGCSSTTDDELIGSSEKYSLYFDGSSNGTKDSETELITYDTVYYLESTGFEAYYLVFDDEVEVTVEYALQNGLISDEDCISLFGNLFKTRDTTIEEKAYYTYPEIVSNAEVIYEEDGFSLLRFSNLESVCSEGIKNFNYINFNINSCGEDFADHGYIVFVDNQFISLEEALRFNVLDESVLIDNIPVMYTENTNVITTNRLDMHNVLGFTYVFTYTDDSVYNSFLSNDVYSFLNDSQDIMLDYVEEYNTNFDVIPVLSVYYDRTLIARYIGTDINEFIYEVKDSSSDIEILDVVGNPEHPYTYGMMGEYDLVRYSNGPVAYVNLDFEYEGIEFTSNIQYSSESENNLVRIGYIAYKDGYYYEIEDLIEDNEISMDQFLRLVPYYYEVD